MDRMICGGLLALAVTLMGIAPARAQYPTKPIRLIVPFPAGSANDTVGRIMGPALSTALGRPVVIDNRPGAGATIGADIVAKSPADGHTVLMGNVAHAVSASLYAKLPYDLVKDFAPVSMLGAGSFMVMAHPSLPAKTLKELIALVKARPGQIDVASSSAGTYLAVELFHTLAGIKMTHIQYKGAPQVVIAAVSGEVPVAFAATTVVMPHVKSSKLRALAVTGARRSSRAPDVPTVAESGVAGYEASPWYGLLVPASTPREIVSRLHAESVQALKLPAVKELFATTDIEPVGSTPEQFGTYIRSEVSKWARVVKVSGIKPE